MVVADVRTVVGTGILRVEGKVADTKVVSWEGGTQASAGRGFVAVVAGIDTYHVAAEVVGTHTSSVVVGHMWSAGAAVAARSMLRMANWSCYPTFPTQHKGRVGAFAEVGEVVERRIARVVGVVENRIGVEVVESRIGAGVVESRIEVAGVAGGMIEVAEVAECRTWVVGMVGCRIAEVVGAIERRTAKVVDGVEPVEMGLHHIGSEAVQDLTNCIGSERAGVETWLSANGCSSKKKMFRYRSAGNEGVERVGEEGVEEAGTFPSATVVRN